MGYLKPTKKRKSWIKVFNFSSSVWCFLHIHSQTQHKPLPLLEKIEKFQMKYLLGAINTGGSAHLHFTARRGQSELTGGPVGTAALIHRIPAVFSLRWTYTYSCNKMPKCPKCNKEVYFGKICFLYFNFPSVTFVFTCRLYRVSVWEHFLVDEKLAPFFLHKWGNRKLTLTNRLTSCQAYDCKQAFLIYILYEFS